MTKNDTIGEWIETTGGPLILTTKKTSETWQGTENDDYDQACETNDYFERLDRSGGAVFVLGDEPSRTTICLEHTGLSILVRWKWAPSESAIIEELRSLDRSFFSDPEEKISLEVSDDMVLFDASVSQPCNGDNPFLEFRLPEGLYEVRTKNLKPNHEIALLLHGFFPLI